MHEFAKFLRYYVGINLFRMGRVASCTSYLRLLNPSSMIGHVALNDISTVPVITASTSQITSPKTSTVSVTTTGTSKEKDNKNPEVAISIPTVLEKNYLDSTSEATEKNDQVSVPTPEPQSNTAENSPLDSTEFEQFFHVSAGQSSFQGSFPMIAAHCGWLLNILDSPYSIPFWLLLMSAPVSATVVGALHMHSCPGATNLSILIFSIGLLYCAAFLIKICRILLKMLDAEECCRSSLRTFFGVTAVLTIGLCVTESAYFWQMESSHAPGTLQYCDPQLVTYAFWWNCFMWFGIIILFFCQS